MTYCYSDLTEIIESELAILDGWKSTGANSNDIQLENVSSKLAYTICDIPNANVSLLPSHTKLQSRIIKDVLRRCAAQTGHKLNVTEYGKSANQANYDEMQMTIERLGCRQGAFVELTKESQRHSRLVLDVYDKLCGLHLIYRAKQIMPYCIECRAPVSNFQHKINSTTKLIQYAVVTFPLRQRANVNILVWTAAAWTLPLNVALCVHPNRKYVEVRIKESQVVYIVAENCLRAIFTDDFASTIDVLTTYDGEQLKGIEYEPLFGYLVNDNLPAGEQPNRFLVVCDSSVDCDMGTGIMALSPHLVAQDFDILNRSELFDTDVLDPMWPIDERGIFVSPFQDLRGCSVFECEKAIVMLLKWSGRLQETGLRPCNVALCIKCNCRLIEKVCVSQFIRVTSVKDVLKKCSREANWFPDFIAEYRLNEWLNCCSDWAISAFHDNGILIPTYLNQNSAVAANRLPADVFHSSFENAAFAIAEYLGVKGDAADDSHSPIIDCIAENIAEAHSWFYALLVLASVLIGKCPVKNVVVTDIVLKDLEDEMTVRSGCLPPIQTLLSRYGGDAYRLYSINSIIKKESALPLIEIELSLYCYDILRPLYQILIEFFPSDANYSFDVQRLGASAKTSLDKWILSRHGQLINDVEHAMTAYQLADITPKLSDFLDELTKWYIHLNRTDTSECFQDVVIHLLNNLAHLMFPFTPFLAQQIENKLHRFKCNETQQPNDAGTGLSERCLDLEIAIQQMKSVIDLAKDIRKRKKIPDAQPLSEMIVIHDNDFYLQNIQSMQTYIRSELNVAQLTIAHDINAYHMRLKVKPIFSRLGRRSNYADLAHSLRRMNDRQIQQSILNGDYCDKENIKLGDINIYYVQRGQMDWNYYEAKSNGNFIVLLNTRLDDQAVQRECIANEIAGYVCDMKKLIRFMSRRHEYIGVFYNLLSYSSNKECMATMKSILFELKPTIEGLIRNDFREFRGEHANLWTNLLIEDEFVICGVKLKIRIFKP